ncbi:MAG: TolC family protein [Bacteroidales bacterium]|nr:TolC family protein [Bacteroidales bacterium]
MKNKLFAALILIVTTAGGLLEGQVAAGELKLSLKEAQEYALQYNKIVISQKYDIEEARLTVLETIARALPQVEATGSLTDNLKLMTTLLPGDFFGRPGEKVPVTFGSQFNSGATIQASLLLFNGPLYIGIETSKLAKLLTEQSLVRSELDTRESVASAYYLVLVAEKTLEILDSNIANLKETLRSTRSMFAAGMAEATDVDQMVSNVTSIENQRISMQRTIELNYNLLRFQLGLAPDTRVILTETLDDITGRINVEATLAQQFDYKQNIDFKLVEGQEKISALALKSQKASTLPTLSSFYQYGTNGMGDELNELQWFPNSMVGLSVSVPIFASGLRYQGIRKAQVNLDKARNQKSMVSDQLLLAEKQLRFNLMNANLQYISMKDNVDVAKRVYESMENKYRQGVASSLDLTQANSLYLQAENNYVQALMSLFQSKIALEKLFNNPIQ